MPRDVQRGGEAEPDGPASKEKRERTLPSRADEERPADRGEGKLSPRTPGKAEGDRSAE
jgi:hypothetical protein